MPRRAPATATPHTAAAHLEGSVGKYQPKRTYFFHFLDRSHPKRHKTCPDFLEIGSPSICVPMPVRAMASRTRAGVMPASHKKGTLQTVLQTYQPKRTELSRIKILARCDNATTTETYKRQTTDFWVVSGTSGSSDEGTRHSLRRPSVEGCQLGAPRWHLRGAAARSRCCALLAWTRAARPRASVARRGSLLAQAAAATRSGAYGRSRGPPSEA